MASYNLKGAFIFLYKGSTAGIIDRKWGSMKTAAETCLGAIYDEITGMAANEFVPTDTACQYNGQTPLILKIGTGKITWSEKQNLEYTHERGKLSPAALGTATIGDDVPMDVSFDAVVEYYVGNAAAKSPREFLQVEGDNGCEPIAADIAVAIKECEDSKMGLFFLPGFRWETLNYDPSGGQMSVAGKCIVPAALKLDASEV